MLDYLDQRDKKPKPFVWTADADLILGKVERLCKRISRSGQLDLQPITTSTDHTVIRVKGKALSVPSAQICGRTVITSGKWLKVALIHDEEVVEGESVPDPESF